MEFLVRLLLARARRKPKHAMPILCASIGRVGSSMLFQAISRARAREIFGSGRDFFRQHLVSEIWDIAGANFQPCQVYKTHDLPQTLAAESLKVVFLYGRPSDSILSVIGRHQASGMEWTRKHFAHLHARGDYDQLLQRDVLRIEEQIEAWRAARSVPVLGLRYETLWENSAVLDDFLGYRIVLPPRAARRPAGVDAATVEQARAAYAKLDGKVAGLPDYFLSHP